VIIRCHSAEYLEVLTAGPTAATVSRAPQRCFHFKFFWSKEKNECDNDELSPDCICLLQMQLYNRTFPTCQISNCDCHDETPGTVLWEAGLHTLEECSGVAGAQKHRCVVTVPWTKTVWTPSFEQGGPRLWEMPCGGRSYLTTIADDFFLMKWCDFTHHQNHTKMIPEVVHFLYLKIFTFRNLRKR